MAIALPDRVTVFWIVWGINILLALTLTVARHEWANAGLTYERGDLLFLVIVIGVFFSVFIRIISMLEWISWFAVTFPFCLLIVLWVAP